MKILEILLEGRVEDFKSKYSQKFSEEQLNRIVLNVPQKFLEWVGKNMDPINFENNIIDVATKLKEFDKVSSNLPKTDINAYKNLQELYDALNVYQNKPRRDYPKIEGGNIVYDDGRFFVVNPQTHKASCYYGKGTQWCTAADSDYHFNKYNDDAKLFYILDRALKTSDNKYKVALLKNFDGGETFYDAKDQTFKDFNLTTGEEVYNAIMTSITNYMNQEYAEQIKIFSDKVAAKKEKERLERVRQQRVLNQRRAELEERRLDGEWELNENCPEEGRKAHALLIFLENNNDVETMAQEDNNRISFLKVEIDRLQAEYDNSEDVNTELLDTISEYEDELEELENKIDVYNIYPTGEAYYDLDVFEVVDAGLNDRRYAVGTEKEMKDSCYEYVEQLIDDIGYEGFNQGFASNYLDVESILDTAREYYEESIRESPTSYLDEDQRMLSDRQEEEIEILKMKIEKAQETIEILEDSLDDDEDGTVKDKIDELESLVSEYESEIEDIESDPDGDFPEDLIEEEVDNLVDGVRRDPEGFLSELGLDWKDYIDKDEFIEGVIDADGYGHTINSYDGNADEYKVLGTYYWVMRID